MDTRDSNKVVNGIEENCTVSAFDPQSRFRGSILNKHENDNGGKYDNVHQLYPHEVLSEKFAHAEYFAPPADQCDQYGRGRHERERVQRQQHKRGAGHGSAGVDRADYHREVNLPCA